MTTVCRWVMVAALCLAPGLAWAQPQEDEQEAQAQQQAPGPGPGGPGMGAPGMMGGGPGMDGRGMMGGGPGGHMMHRHHDGRDGMHGHGMGGPGGRGAIWERIDGRLAFLRTELRITDQQNAAWNKFADALKAIAAQVKEARPSGPPMNLKDHLERHERRLTQRLENTRSLRAAFVPLYDSLTDMQRETAEELLSVYLRR